MVHVGGVLTNANAVLNLAGGGFYWPKLGLPKAYLAYASSRLCEFISPGHGHDPEVSKLTHSHTQLPGVGTEFPGAATMFFI